MKRIDYHIIQTARDGVDELDHVRMRNGISQAGISKLADTPDTGQQYLRMFGSGDVKLSKYLRFLHAVGCDLIITERGREDDTC